MSEQQHPNSLNDPSTEFLPKFVRERFDLGWIIAFFKHKQVPVHRHSVWYYMGGIALFLFLVQVITGILLMVHYTRANRMPASWRSCHRLISAG